VEEVCKSCSEGLAERVDVKEEAAEVAVT
jgi:hypothetical protein